MIHPREKDEGKEKKKRTGRNGESWSSWLLVPRTPEEGGIPCDPVTNGLIILYRLTFVTDARTTARREYARMTFPCLMRCLLNSAEKEITRVA